MNKLIGVCKVSKKRIFLLSLIVLLLMTSLIAGCSIQNKIEEPKIGKYVIQGVESELMAWVLLKENKEFQFNRNIYMSYLPFGTYSIDGNKLILYVNENESYLFIIAGDNLIFESSNGINAIVEKGTVFKLSNEL